MQTSLRVILDTNEYIFGLDLSSQRTASIALLDRLPQLLQTIDGFQLFVPDIIREEVQRNLPYDLLPVFYRLIMTTPKVNYVSLFDVPVEEVWYHREQIGLKLADATIAACAKWQNVDVLISENRHFLKKNIDDLLVCNAQQFLAWLDDGTIWERLDL